MHKPIPVNKVNLLLLSLLAFFLPWGEGMREVAGNISWVFPVLVVLLLAANRRVLLHPRSYGLFCLPPAVKWLLVFVAVHTTIYLWLNPELLAFGKSVSTTAAGGVAKVKSATGDVFLRYFLYAAFGLLLALFMRSKRCFARFWLCYGLGFTATVFLGAGLQVAGGLVRATAGYSDPNVMAMDALIVMFGSTYMLTTVRGGAKNVIWNVCARRGVCRGDVVLAGGDARILRLPVGVAVEDGVRQECSRHTPACRGAGIGGGGG